MKINNSITSAPKGKKNSNIRFNIKDALFLIEWSYDDFLLKTEIKIDRNGNLNCTISFYLRNVPINIHVLDKKEIVYFMKLYDQQLRCFLIEEENKIKSRISLYKFLTILNFKKQRRFILWKLESNIQTISLDDPSIRIVTQTYNFRDSINYINIESNTKLQSVFLIIHTTNLFLINKLKIIIIRRLFTILNYFIKIIRILTLIFTSIGMTMSSISFLFDFPINASFILTSASITIFSLVAFFSSSVLKSRISNLIINYLLSK